MSVYRARAEGNVERDPRLRHWAKPSGDFRRDGCSAKEEEEPYFLYGDDDDAGNAPVSAKITERDGAALAAGATALSRALAAARGEGPEARVPFSPDARRGSPRAHPSGLRRPELAPATPARRPP